MYPFEKLAVWQEARELTKSIYHVTASFPKSEQFGLLSQLRRASVSVCSNLAEGSTRRSAKDQARFYEIAYGSLVEIYNQLIISTDLGFVKNEVVEPIKNDIKNTSYRIIRLRKAMEAR